MFHVKNFNKNSIRVIKNSNSAAGSLMKISPAFYEYLKFTSYYGNLEFKKRKKVFNIFNEYATIN